nr:related to nitrogenase molybdenum-cofactor synthesis protein nifN [imported] - Neurospora crassa [Neurospora crassa]
MVFELVEAPQANQSVATLTVGGLLVAALVAGLGAGMELELEFEMELELELVNATVILVAQGSNGEQPVKFSRQQFVYVWQTPEVHFNLQQQAEALALCVIPLPAIWEGSGRKEVEVDSTNMYSSELLKCGDWAVVQSSRDTQQDVIALICRGVLMVTGPEEHNGGDGLIWNLARKARKSSPVEQPRPSVVYMYLPT